MNTLEVVDIDETLIYEIDEDDEIDEKLLTILHVEIVLG
jgi:hypothetical protein